MARTSGPVAVIPARGGSKRIPRKNIRPFLGTPLLARTIAVLHASQLFDRIVVSTDDDEIAEIALEAGAEVPFRRPDGLADDHAATAPVIAHAIEQLELDTGQSIDEICVAYPAAVFTRVRDLVAAREILASGAVEHVFSATRYAAPILRAWRRGEDGTATMIWPEYRNTRSQDLDEAFHDAGQFYWSSRDAWMDSARGASVRRGMLVLPRWRVHDIDTEEDWIVAEAAYLTLERLGLL